MSLHLWHQECSTEICCQSHRTIHNTRLDKTERSLFNFDAQSLCHCVSQVMLWCFYTDVSDGERPFSHPNLLKIQQQEFDRFQKGKLVPHHTQANLLAEKMVDYGCIIWHHLDAASDDPFTWSVYPCMSGQCYCLTCQMQTKTPLGQTLINGKWRKQTDKVLTISPSISILGHGVFSMACLQRKCCK